MSTKMENEKRIQGHPCRGCPYVFTKGGTDCIMGAVPGDCAWYFYKRLMGHEDAFVPVEEIREQYRESMKRRSLTEDKLSRGIDMLLETAELKYGKGYAQHLKKKIESKDFTVPTEMEWRKQEGKEIHEIKG